jgi:hypothetical protein
MCRRSSETLGVLTPETWRPGAAAETLQIGAAAKPRVWLRVEPVHAADQTRRVPRCGIPWRCSALAAGPIRWAPRTVAAQPNPALAYGMAQRMPPLADLHAFALLSETGGLTRLAAQLNVSQPAASKRLRALEEWVGQALVRRRANRIVLTPVGAEYAAA